jgi:hypothetical protein
MFLATSRATLLKETSMLRLAFLAIFGLVLAGCASERTDGASSGASATQPSNQDMRDAKKTPPAPSRGY